MCIQSPQPTLYTHVQRCVSSRQARTTAVPGAGIPELKLLWAEAVLYKVRTGFKNGAFVSAVLHFLTFNLSLRLRGLCNTLFVCYSIYYSLDFLTKCWCKKKKKGNQKIGERIRFFFILHI